MRWEVIFYETPSGQRVVSKFIQSLDAATYAKTLRHIELLKDYGTALSMPHSKPLGNGLIELRVRGKREVRIFYTYITGKQIILLHGFIKKTQATPKRELDIARTRQREIDNL